MIAWHLSAKDLFQIAPLEVTGNTKQSQVDILQLQVGSFFWEVMGQFDVVTLILDEILGSSKWQMFLPKGGKGAQGGIFGSLSTNPIEERGGFSRIGNGWIPLLQEGRRNDAERLSRVELQVSALHQRGGSGADRVVGKLVKVWIVWRLLDL